MILVSIYYLIGGAIVLPTLTYTATRWWYHKKIDAILSSEDFDKVEDIIGDVLLSPNSIRDAEELSPTQLSFRERQVRVETQLKKNIWS